MRQYTWDEYYEKFYDWAESTQVRNLSGLTSLGSADEVGEIIIELQTNVPAANRLLRKAVDASSFIRIMCFSASESVRQKMMKTWKERWSLCSSLASYMNSAGSEEY